MSSPIVNEAAAEDEDVDSQAMAQFMGFASFGTQEQNRPSKKRRFNSHVDDAVVAGGAATRPAGLPPKPPAPVSSGANSLPLHSRSAGGAAGSKNGTSSEQGKRKEKAKVQQQQQPSSAKPNADELDLSDSDQDEEDDDISVSSSNPDPNDGRLRFHVNTPFEVVQAAVEAKYPGRVLPEGWHLDPDDKTVIWFGNEPPIHIPEAMARKFSRRTIHSGGSGPFDDLIDTVPDRSKQWWTDYYDRSSNENPWERLEKARGLEPVGSWIATAETSHHQQRNPRPF
jgi:hypothetical protein